MMMKTMWHRHGAVGWVPSSGTRAWRQQRHRPRGFKAHILEHGLARASTESWLLATHPTVVREKSGPNKKVVTWLCQTDRSDTGVDRDKRQTRRCLLLPVYWTLPRSRGLLVRKCPRLWPMKCRHRHSRTNQAAGRGGPCVSRLVAKHLLVSNLFFFNNQWFWNCISCRFWPN